MKTSNKLLLAALVVLLCSLAAYNMALKSEYDTGAYKDPLGNHSLLSFQDFDEIVVYPADMLKVRIEKGDRHEVYLKNGMEDRVQVSQAGKRLHIRLALTEQTKVISGNQGEHHLVIRTPHVKLVRADAIHTMNGKEETWQKDKMRYMDYYGVTLAGLELDSLSLELDNGSLVKLENNALKSLQVTSGSSYGSEPTLQISPNNKLQQASLDIRNGSILVLENVAIPQLSYTFSDSAQLRISGASIAALKK
ncbi:hypothetical protein [Pontibacter roseus]|uniref:hypothetical protein n=1 Tax=Pontibacter roseus TaxID=336989 RepID=UPI0003734F29|nr:hypothetical protein [Pontibacter roseus]